MNTINKQSFCQDFLWYFTGSIVPAVISLIKLPIFTRYFTAEEYGYFTLISGTFMYFSMFIFSWIASCLWRFYTEAKNENRLNELYSNLFFLASAGTIILLLISLVWITMANSRLVILLVSLSFFQLVTGQILSIYLITVRIEGKALFYNVIYSIQALGAFGLLFLLAFQFNSRIESILTGQVIINLLLIFYLILRLKRPRKISLKAVSLGYLGQLLTYGSVGLLTNFCILLLTTSDRYIIALYSEMRDVGIYNQIYALGQFSVYYLVTVFFNTINPDFLKILTSKKETKNLQINSYIKLFVLILLPLTFYFSLFSKQIANILLGEEFRSGYRIIPFIMFSSFIYGLTLFSETKLKFEKSYRNVLLGVIISTALNIILNFLLIPIFGYQAAAVTTLFSYICLFLFFNLGNKRLLNFDVFYLKILFLLIVQGFFDLMIRKVFNVQINELFTIIEGLIFLLIYFGTFNRQIRDVLYFDYAAK